MIAGGDDIDAKLEEFFRDLRRDAEAAGRVLAVGDRQVDAILFLQLGKPLMNDGATGPGEDVAYEENAQSTVSLF